MKKNFTNNKVFLEFIKKCAKENNFEYVAEYDMDNDIYRYLLNIRSFKVKISHNKKEIINIEMMNTNNNYQKYSNFINNFEFVRDIILNIIRHFYHAEEL